MVVVELDGRLGNQMFQYALGMVISKKRNSTLHLFIDKKKGNKFELNFFKLSINFRDINLAIETLFKFFKLMDKFSTKLNFPLHIFFREQSLSYDVNVFSKRFLFYSGYFQSEKYFNNNTNAIKECFEFKKDKLNIPYELLSKIEASNSVSVHFRRGDYIACKETFDFHGVLGNEYYRSAIDYVSKYLNKPTFFIFSDDIDWVRNNIYLPKSVFYCENNSPISDLYLMTQCKHNIIANSSFSWWGAWLNKNKNKIVCAPRRWFNSDTIDFSDLIPKNWIKF